MNNLAKRQDDEFSYLLSQVLPPTHIDRITLAELASAFRLDTQLVQRIRLACPELWLGGHILLEWRDDPASLESPHEDPTGFWVEEFVDEQSGAHLLIPNTEFISEGRPIWVLFMDDPYSGDPVMVAFAIDESFKGYFKFDTGCTPHRRTCLADSCSKCKKPVYGFDPGSRRKFFKCPCDD